VIEKTRRRLREAIVRHFKGDYNAAAQAVGCTREHLYNLASDVQDKRPSLDCAYAIQLALRVPMSGWANKPGVNKRSAA
jgi:hypothetical protein